MLIEGTRSEAVVVQAMELLLLAESCCLPRCKAGVYIQLHWCQSRRQPYDSAARNLVDNRESGGGVPGPRPGVIGPAPSALVVFAAPPLFLHHLRPHVLPLARGSSSSAVSAEDTRK